MLSEGRITIDSLQVELSGLDEQRFRSLFPHALETRRNGVHVNYSLAPTVVEGESCFATFYFTEGWWSLLSLELNREDGPEWADKIWELSYLQMLEQVHASWLGTLMGRDVPVRDAEFDWGGASVRIDTKGWGTRLCVSPTHSVRPP